MNVIEALPNHLGMPHEKRNLHIQRVKNVWYIKYGEHSHHSSSGNTLEKAATHALAWIAKNKYHEN